MLTQTIEYLEKEIHSPRWSSNTHETNMPRLVVNMTQLNNQYH